MVRKWTLSSGKAGFKINTYEVPRHVVIFEAAFDKLCWLTGGWLGGHGMPTKFWEIPVGPAVRDEEGYIENSIASKFYALENAVYQWSFKSETNHVEILITEDEARAIDPKFVSDMEEIHFLPDGYKGVVTPEVDNVLPFHKP